MISVSDWLQTCLMKNHPRQGGLGVRPEYFGGRGATQNDLPPTALDGIFDVIEKNAGKEAAQAFAQMVADIPKLTATDFLLNLERLDRAGYKWSKSMLGNENGVHATDEGSAMGNFLSMMGGMGDRDETVSIRGMFLRRHGLQETRGGGFDQFGYTTYDDCYPRGSRR